MSQKMIGVLVMLAGLALVAISIVLFLDVGDSEPTAGTELPDSTTSSAVPQSSTSVADLQRPTTTTTLPTPTTTLNQSDLVSTFIEQFSMAIADGDADFVFSRLHPDIVSGFGEDVCRTWVDVQIMGLSDYVATGAPQGPTEGILETPGGTVSFDNRYSVDVSFSFGGQDFEATADFIVQNDDVFFTGSCES